MDKKNSGNFKIDLYSRSPENSQNLNYVLSSPLTGEMKFHVLGVPRNEEEFHVMRRSST